MSMQLTHGGSVHYEYNCFTSSSESFSDKPLLLLKNYFLSLRWWRQWSRTTGCLHPWTVPWCCTSWCWSAGWRRETWGPNSPALSAPWTSFSATPPASRWWPAPTQGEFKFVCSNIHVIQIRPVQVNRCCQMKNSVPLRSFTNSTMTWFS